MHQIAPFKKNSRGGACPRTPLERRGAKRPAIHPASGMYIPPQYYPPHV